MRILFTLLALLLLAVALGWTLQQSAGGVVFSYGEWTVQTSLVVFVVVAALLFLLGYVVFRALGKLLRAPADLRRWSEVKRQRRSEKCLNQGMLAMLEGDWRNAEEAFSKGATLSRTPLVNYLGAAQAAYRRGDAECCNRYLAAARRHDDGNSPALGLTQARLQIDQQQAEQADHTLSSLDDKHEQVTLMLLETATALKDWPRAVALVKACRRRGDMPPQQARAQQLTSCVELLRRAGDEDDPDALAAVWREIPYRQKKQNVLVRAYVRERLRHGDDRGCEVMLRRALKRQWDPELVRLFGLVEGRSLQRQLEFAENSLSRFPRDAALLLTLGRLSKKLQLWGKAGNYLEQSNETSPSPEACQELALLLEERGDYDTARKYFRQGLKTATEPQTAARPSAGSLVAVKNPS